MIFGARKKEPEPIALIDFGSSSVGVAVVAPPPADQTEPKILFSSRQSFDDYAGELTYKRFIQKTAAALKKALGEAATAGFAHPAIYHCFLSSPYCISQTKIITHAPAKPFIFTSKLLEQISGNEVQTFLNEHDSLYPELVNDSFAIIENQPMKIELNGYSPSQPFDRTASQAQIAQFISGSSTQTLKQLEQLIRSASHYHGPIRFHTFSYSAYELLHDFLGKKGESFIIVDVAGELTDLIIVTQGILAEHISIPFGRSTLIRQLAEQFGTLQAEAETRLRMFVAGTLEPKALQACNQALLKVKESWLTLFRDALHGALENSILPENLIIVGLDASSKVFMSWMQESHLQNFTLSSASFTAETIENIAGAHLPADNKPATDGFLLLESAFYGTMKHNSKS